MKVNLPVECGREKYNYKSYINKIKTMVIFTSTNTHLKVLI